MPRESKITQYLQGEKAQQEGEFVSAFNVWSQKLSAYSL